MLEGPLFNRFLDVLLAALLVAFFLPSVAWYAVVAGISSMRGRSTRSAISQMDFAGIGLLKRQFAGEFNFERAIDAYEELIDSTFAGGRS